jgi:hypothetical protein
VEPRAGATAVGATDGDYGFGFFRSGHVVEMAASDVVKRLVAVGADWFGRGMEEETLAADPPASAPGDCGAVILTRPRWRARFCAQRFASSLP